MKFFCGTTLLTLTRLSENELTFHITDSLVPAQLTGGGDDFLSLQSRLDYQLTHFLNNNQAEFSPRFCLMKGEEDEFFFSLLKQAIEDKIKFEPHHYHYFINNQYIKLSDAHPHGNLASTDACITSVWSQEESLFGCVREPERRPVKLQAGAVHRANGGVLILGLRSLLLNPALLDRLKKIVQSKRYDWQSGNDNSVLQYGIPSMPINLKVILVGDRDSLSELQHDDATFFNSQIYAEFESVKLIKQEHDYLNWLGYQQFIAQQFAHIHINSSAFDLLIHQGIKTTEDRYYLPLSPRWFVSQFTGVNCDVKHVNYNSLKESIDKQNWAKNYLKELFLESILSKQILIQTQGEQIGQINGLSVMEYPGYPKEIGEPMRITCVLHAGDGELLDIERKTELAGNLHSKGMMITNALLSSEFCKKQTLPFTASLVFEQSYNEVDGDSASLAGLLVILSALSDLPIDQQIAVTGSIDQFGRIQSIGAVNEKIRGFYEVCKFDGFTGKQGVIIPQSNVRHLCLDDDIVDAIRKQQFHVWTAAHFSDAVPLLLSLNYKDSSGIDLYHLIVNKLKQFHQNERTSKRTWLNFSKR